MHKLLWYFLGQSLTKTQEGKVLGDHVPPLVKQGRVNRGLGTDKMATGIHRPTLIHTLYPDLSEALFELGIPLYP